jgi:hypothetical protein
VAVLLDDTGGAREHVRIAKALRKMPTITTAPQDRSDLDQQAA